MGLKNFIIEGVSGTGKTTVCDELQRRGYHALHGDRVLRPDIKRTHIQILNLELLNDDLERAEWIHRQAIWDVDKVRYHIENRDAPMSFFCGGFRNHADLVRLFDAVFTLEVDRETLTRRLANRPEDEFGGRQAEQELILRLYQTKEDLPKEGITVDASVRVEDVVDELLNHACKISDRVS